MEKRYFHKTGRIVWVLLSVSLVRDLEGRPLHFISQIQNITERKRAEVALHESEALLRTAGRTARFGGWSADLATRKVVWSEQVAVIHEKEPGYCPSTDEGIQFYAPQWRQKIAALFDACAREGVPYDEEMEIVTARGRRLWVRTTGEAVRDSSGQIVRVQGAFQDINEQRQAEEALEPHRAELQAIYDHAPVMMCVLDRDRRVLYANRAFTEFTGISEGDLKSGRACDVLGCINAQDDPRGCGFGPACQGCDLRRALDVTLRTGVGHRNIEYRATIEHNTSRRAVVLIGATAAIHTGEHTNVLLCLEDRTEQEQAEQRARQRELELLHVARLSTLGEMASGLAHELSQPLSAIVNYSTACVQLGSADQPDLQRIVKNIQRITEQAERARDIMVRIRELAQRRRPRLASVDVNRVIANVLDLLSWQIRQKGIDLNPDLDDRLPAARADVVQVEQVLVNLTRNAIEAMEQTPLQHRRLTIRTGSGEGGAVRIEVSDAGVGIPRDEPDRIFDAFFTTKADGLGIGLSISRTIVEMHKGTLNATRNPESGSTFVLVLPTVSGPDA